MVRSPQQTHTARRVCVCTVPCFACALLCAVCEPVLLSSSESVLLSCSNSPSWPSRSRGLVSVVKHTPHTGHAPAVAIDDRELELALEVVQHVLARPTLAKVSRRFRAAAHWQRLQETYLGMSSCKKCVAARRRRRRRPRRPCSSRLHHSRGPCAGVHTNVAPVMFGKPLLNNVLTFDHVQLQK